MMKTTEFFVVKDPAGNVVAKVESTMHVDGSRSHFYSSRKAWHVAGCDYTGTPEGISHKALLAVGYTFNIVSENAA